MIDEPLALLAEAFGEDSGSVIAVADGFEPSATPAEPLPAGALIAAVDVSLIAVQAS